MQKKGNKHLNAEINKFKVGIKHQLIQLGIVQIGNSSSKNEHLNSNDMANLSKTLLKYINDFKPVQFTNEDFKKRTRVKNIVPVHNRCIALRSDGEQCSRRKKNGQDFCGTHIKGIPHGKKNNTNQLNKEKKINVWTQDIKGIIYYIDDECNVYNPEDILNNKCNPGIIAKYSLKKDEYKIEKYL